MSGFMVYILGGAIALIGLWALWAGLGITRWAGGALIALGAVMGYSGWLRARLRSTGDGPGMVELREQRVSYFSAFDGVSFALEEIQAALGNVVRLEFPG